MRIGHVARPYSKPLKVGGTSLAASLKVGRNEGAKQSIINRAYAYIQQHPNATLNEAMRAIGNH